MKSTFTIGVFAAIFDEAGRILCVKRNYGPKNWTAPGGAMDSGESPFQALQRETREESGYLVDPLTMQHIGTYCNVYKDDIVFSIKAEIIGKEDWQPDEEIAQVAFFHKHELPPMKQATQLRIHDAFEGKIGVMSVIEQPE